MTAKGTAPVPMGDGQLDRLLAMLAARVRADGLVLVTGGRNAQPLRSVTVSSSRPSPDDTLLPWLVAQSAPVIIGDLARDVAPATSAWLDAEGARSLLAVRLEVDGAGTGTMAAFSRQRDHFAPADATAAELMGAVVALALEWLERARAAESVLEIARIVNSRGNISELLNEACQRAARLCDAERASLFLFDDRGRRAASFSANASGRPDPEMFDRFRKAWQAGRPVSQSAMTTWILEKQRPLVIDDYGDSPFGDPEIVAAFGTRSIVALPMLRDGRVVGLMTIDRTEVRPFTPDEVRQAMSMADSIAPVVERARLLDEAETQLRQAEAQVEIARSLTSTLELKPLLRVIAQQAAQACGMDRCSVFLYRGERLVPVMSQFADGRVDPDLWELFKAQEAQGLERVSFVEEAVETRAPVIIDDVQTDPRFPVSLRSFHGKRALALPLTRPNKMVGVLVLEYVDRDRPIRPAQVSLGTTIGTQIALALENARLLAETQSQATALREKNAELDGFVHTVSHDLKAPLLTIQGMAGLVLDEYGPALPADGRHYLERIQTNTQQMERLILDLLALSRIGREARPPEDVHLAELVNEILTDLSEPLRAGGIKVVVGDLPSVWAIRVQMEQVFRNLVTNAIKYMGNGPSPAIEIGTLARGAELECWVRDTGIGIDAAYHDKVFEIFQRLKEVEAEGSGVGLSIVKKIVEAAGGRIWVESARGEGATFRFTWPGGTMR